MDTILLNARVYNYMYTANKDFFKNLSLEFLKVKISIEKNKPIIIKITYYYQ